MKNPLPFSAPLLLACVTLHAAEGLRTVPESASALGFAGGRLTLLDDPSVVRINPASMTTVDRPALMLNWEPFHGVVGFTNSAGGTDETGDPWKHTGSLHYVHPLNDTLAVGLGVSAPFGTAIQWTPDGPLRYSAAYDANLRTTSLTPAVGLKLNDRISVGVGLDIYRSDLHLEQRYPWGPLLGATLPDGNLLFEGSGWGIGAYAGLNLAISDRQRIAVVGRLPASVDYDGDFRIDYNPLPGAPPTRSPFATEIEFPGGVAVGYGFDMNKRLSVGIDFDWTGNSTHDDLPLSIGKNQSLLASSTVPLGWQDSYSLGAGLRYRATEALVLRAGYQYSASPMPGATWNPSVPADDRHLLTAGIGYSSGNHTIDVAYGFVAMGPTTIRGNVQPAFNGTYRHDWNLLAIGYTRRF